MIDIEDRDRQPGIAEIDAYIGNPLFGELRRRMDGEHQALYRIEYSGDKVLLGWNVKFKKAGRTLCTAYPREGHFPMLLVVAPREKQRVEALLPSLSEAFQRIYRGTQEGMGQRWLLLDIGADNAVRGNALLDDACEVIRIRRQSK